MSCNLHYNMFFYGFMENYQKVMFNMQLKCNISLEQIYKENSASGGIIRPWQVIWCSTY